MHDAVRNGCLEAVCHNLEFNAENVNQRDGSGNTPLLLAVCIADEEIYNTIVARLIEKGADVNLYNKGNFHKNYFSESCSAFMRLREIIKVSPKENELNLFLEICN